MNFKKIAFFIFVNATLLSCEDVIDFNLRADGENQLVVDAWLNNTTDIQKIVLSYSQPYFDNAAPTMVSNARVYLVDEDKTRYPFTEGKEQGVYEYKPTSETQTLSKIGKKYQLFVENNGQVFTSVTKINRVPAIDSVRYEYFQLPFAPSDTVKREGYIAEFFARDFPGIGDTYWVRYKKNGVRDNSPSQITLAYDAGFSPGSQSDGLIFIQPIRRSINSGPNLYQDGDEIEVELSSISNDAFFFLSLVRQESSNGGIFAVPSGNIPTNIVNVNKDSREKALGFFAISAVSTYKTKVKKELAKR